VLGDPDDDFDLHDDCSDTESENGSSSSGGSGLGSLAEYGLEEDDDNMEQIPMCDNETSIEGSCGSSSASKTLAKDSVKDATDIESDCDDISIVQEQLDSLSIASVKEKNQIYQELVNLSPSCSKSTTELVKQKLSGKKNPMLCDLCGEYMDGELGLKIHKSRKHK